jgi:hypothetical protein
MLGRSIGLGTDQLKAERVRDSTRDLVLQGEQIAHVAVEPLRPQMGVGLGIDQLRVDAHLVPRPLDDPLQNIAHAQLAADLLRVDRLASIGEGGITRDHETVRDP